MMNKRSYILHVVILLAIVLLPSCSGKPEPLSEKHDDMINDQLVRRGITDEAVIRAMREVPREQFVLPKYRDKAYDDVEAPIAFGEALNRPYEDAVMLGAVDIKPSDRVLEIGTGTGYVTSLMSGMAKVVYTIEIEPSYADEARRNFKKLNYDNIHVKTGDGFLGWPEKAPFDVIIMMCSPPHIPKPLEDQLAEGGRMLLPLGGNEKFQELVLYTKKDGRLTETRRLAPTTFAPMKGIILEDKESGQ